MSNVVRQFIREALVNQDFVHHMKIGIDRIRDDVSAQAYQITSDWLEEVELHRGDLLSPGYVTQVERYVAHTLPDIVERFRGDQYAVVQTITNLLDTKFADLRRTEHWDDERLR